MDMTAEQIAEKIKASDTWDSDLLKELCNRAGLEKEWEEADGENFEEVAEKASEILGVNLF